MAHKTTFAMATVVCMSTWMAGERATAEVVAVAGNGFEIRETAYTAGRAGQGVCRSADPRPLVEFRTHIFGKRRESRPGRTCRRLLVRDPARRRFRRAS